MKVALINTLPLDSSITKENIAFVNALSKDTDVLVILKEEDAWHKLDILDKRVKSRLLKIFRTLDVYNIYSAYKIIKIIDDFKPDVIDLRTGYPWISIILPYLKKYPLVSTFYTAKSREGEKEKIPYRITDYLTRKYADKIIVFDQFSKNIFIKEFKLNPKKIHIIPAGNYTEILARIGKTNIFSKEKNILFLGRIVKYKGLEYLIKAEPLITKEVPNSKIIIAGSCDNFEDYESIMTNRGSYLIYNGWISDEMVVELFQKSTVVVFPYTEFSKSGNIHLAYAFKKPIVATNLGSISEYVINNETGFLVPARDIEELSKAIIKLLKNDNLAQKMGQNGYDFMKQNFSWKEIVYKTKDVYEKAIESHSK